ncbi:AraC family transcriptional regulator [Kordiimonas sp. SCSIO 12610]|uniref:AraC family transcriptional regulator n=1 Tax=Kordiimonas sp. SCSIO 12610 TaxID=2829597 RepID=UPI0021086591|nr:AraC family transcriptional regulator [Kordiimonas sp. SCSIO 12610]UTW56494.1 AraC family transcriptional regulator ligand-binding domain-containing protein [Kordiimonas sp. SCSIO 12610]
MINLNSTRPPTSLRILCDVAVEMGMPREDFLKGTGLSLDDLYSPDRRITLAQEVRATENFLERQSDSFGIGVTVGNRFHVNVFGIWGFAILSSPTLRSAIQTAIDYTSISLILADIEVGEYNDTPLVNFKMDHLPERVQFYAFERHLTVTLGFMKELIPNFDKQQFRILTSAKDKSYREKLSELLDVSVGFHEQLNALALGPYNLDTPLPRSDPATLDYCLKQCSKLLEEQGGVLAHWSRQVQNKLMQDMGAGIKLRDIACKLGTTERTLRRRLQEEGTSFRAVYTDARLGIARELLETVGLSVEETAWRVGYSEPAAFIRAFSSRFSRTPGKIKKRNSP